MRVLTTNQLGCYGSCGDTISNLFAFVINSDIHQLEHICTKACALGCYNETNLTFTALASSSTVRNLAHLLLYATEVRIADRNATEIGCIAAEIRRDDVGRILYDRSKIDAETAAIAHLIYRMGRVCIIEHGFLLVFRLLLSRATPIDCYGLEAIVLVALKYHLYRHFLAGIILVAISLAEVESVVCWVKLYVVV